jgi:YfiH family protein
VQAGGRPALVCRALEPFAPHLMTTRDWRLGLRSAAPGTAIDAAWQEVAAAAGSALIRVHQVHGTGVLVRRAGDTGEIGQNGLSTADAIVSNDRSFALAVQTADCVPVLLADRRTGAVAAVHAGWRGLAAGVLRIAIDVLAEEFGTRPSDLMAAAGPSIGACCYEVGADVREQFDRAAWPAATADHWFSTTPKPTARNPSMAGVPRALRAGHSYFDSAASARDQLASAGIPASQIFLADLCTASHPGTLCSYRRDGSPAGRMAAVISPARPRRP